MLCPNSPVDELLAIAEPPPVPTAVELADATPDPTAEPLAVALANPALPCVDPAPPAPQVAFDEAVTFLHVDVSACLRWHSNHCHQAEKPPRIST